MKRAKTLSQDWKDESRKSEMDSARSWSDGASIEDKLLIGEVVKTHNGKWTSIFMTYLETTTETKGLEVDCENWADFYANPVTTLSLENLV